MYEVLTFPFESGLTLNRLIHFIKMKPFKCNYVVSVLEYCSHQQIPIREWVLNQDCCIPYFVFCRFILMDVNPNNLTRYRFFGSGQIRQLFQSRIQIWWSAVWSISFTKVLKSLDWSWLNKPLLIASSDFGARDSSPWSALQPRRTSRTRPTSKLNIFIYFNFQYAFAETYFIYSK